MRNSKQDIFARISKTESCWIWAGYVNPQSGYGHVGFNGRQQRAHRVVYELLVGKIPAGLQLDHLCRNRKCVNPRHLEPVTNRENVLRGETVTGRNFRKTHCKRGHPLRGRNLLRRGNWRICDKCRVMMKTRWYAANRPRILIESRAKYHNALARLTPNKELGNEKQP